MLISVRPNSAGGLDINKALLIIDGRVYFDALVIRYLLSTFLILKQPPDEIKILNILTYVGLTLSLLGDVITIICYLLLA